MGVDRTFKDQADLQGLQGDAIIDLMTIDLAPVSDEIMPENRYVRFVNWVVTDGQKVFYGGLAYEPVPFKATGFAIQTEGVPPNPSLAVSNIGLEFTALVNTWDDLIGAKLTRRRVLARHLDSGSAPDANAHWPDEVWTIQQKESENKLLVTFRLSTAFDLDGVTLPRRRALRYTCPWTYRGEGCDYAGPPVADAKDQALVATGQDQLTAAVINFRNALPLARYELVIASQRYGELNDALARAIAYRDYWAGLLAGGPRNGFLEERYSLATSPRFYVTTNTLFPYNTVAVWNDQEVTLGAEYRKGVIAERYEGSSYEWYVIQRWGEDTAEYAQWQANYQYGQTLVASITTQVETAGTTLNGKRQTFESTQTAYRNAVAAWQATPPSEAVIRASGDVCGKRLASCRLRFYDPAADAYDSLPFGGFPGLTT